MKATLTALLLSLTLLAPDAHACINDMHEHKKPVAEQPTPRAEEVPEELVMAPAQDLTPEIVSAEPLEEEPQSAGPVLASIGGAAGLGAVFLVGLAMSQRRREQSWQSLS